MKRLLLSLVLLGALANLASAATVIVRSGEHDGFTRLVFSLPVNVPGWDLKETTTGYRLVLEDKLAVFETGNVYRRISQERLHELKTTDQGGEIELVLACKCQADAFLSGQNLLVVDLHDADLPDKDRLEDMSAANLDGFSDQRGPPKAAEFGQPLAFSLTGQPPARKWTASFTLGLENVSRPGVPWSHDLGRQYFGILPEHFATRRRSTQLAQDRLVDQLTRAVTQGLVKPTGPFLTIPNQNGHGTTDPTSHPAGRQPLLVTTGLQPSQSETPANMNLKAGNSIDREVLSLLGRMPPQHHETSCFQDYHFSFEEWADDAPLRSQIGFLRSQLFSETDRVDPEMVTTLARIYLYFGFGAEARDILSLKPNDSTFTKVLTALTFVVDGEPNSDAAVLHNQLECDTRAALWGVLSKHGVTPGDQLNVQASLEAFNALPSHLRRHLGPGLSEKLISMGHVTAAETVLTFTQRGSAENRPQIDIVDARLDMSEGNVERARASLEVAVNANSEKSPGAMVALVEVHAAENTAVSEDMAALVAALAFENRNQPLGPDLRRAHVIARALANQFDAAAVALFDVETRDGQVAAAAVLSELTDKATTMASDISFLDLMLGQPEGLLQHLKEKPANAAAERLLELGFHKQAGRLVAGGSTGVNGRQRRLLRSRIALAAHKPRKAQAELIGLSGGDVDELRATARARSGEYGVAQALFASVEKPKAALHAAMMSDNWAALAKSDDVTYAAIGALMEGARTDDTPRQIEQTGESFVLAKNRRLLQESVQTRRIFRDFLVKHEVTVAVEH